MIFRCEELWLSDEADSHKDGPVSHNTPRPVNNICSPISLPVTNRQGRIQVTFLRTVRFLSHSSYLSLRGWSGKILSFEFLGRVEEWSQTAAPFTARLATCRINKVKTLSVEYRQCHMSAYVVTNKSDTW